MTTINLKKQKIPSHIQKSLDQILYELEQYGRAVSNNGHASRYLSFRFKKPRDKGDIFFTWSKRWKKSIIVLSPYTKLIRLSDNKVKLLRLTNDNNHFILEDIKNYSKNPYTIGKNNKRIIKSR